MNENHHNPIEEDITTFCIETCPNNEYFDQVIGHIEDIVVDDKFKELQNNFLEENWSTFENTDENKVEYIDIFNQYTTILENFLVDELNKRMDNFDMELFSNELQQRKNCLDGEIFDLLLSFSDFVVFKELMLDYRSGKEESQPNINFDIIVTRIPDKNIL